MGWFMAGIKNADLWASFCLVHTFDFIGYTLMIFLYLPPHTH